MMLLPLVLFLHLRVILAIQGAIYIGMLIPVVSVLVTTPVVGMSKFYFYLLAVWE